MSLNVRVACELFELQALGSNLWAPSSAWALRFELQFLGLQALGSNRSAPSSDA